LMCSDGGYIFAGKSGQLYVLGVLLHVMLSNFLFRHNFRVSECFSLRSKKGSLP
jgi:hypothetical protein